jgi:hypothetical protein
VTLDFPNRTLYLARGGHFSDADEPDMSGLHLIREGDKTLVYSVDAGSPAAAFYSATAIETGISTTVWHAAKTGSQPARAYCTALNKLRRTLRLPSSQRFLRKHRRNSRRAVICR